MEVKPNRVGRIRRTRAVYPNLSFQLKELISVLIPLQQIGKGLFATDPALTVGDQHVAYEPSLCSPAPCPGAACLSGQEIDVLCCSSGNPGFDFRGGNSGCARVRQ